MTGRRANRIILAILALFYSASAAAHGIDPDDLVGLNPAVIELSAPATSPQGLTGGVSGYVVLGIKHILGGPDHLLLVLALLLLVEGWQRLLLTITAFTVAHSITLALTVLDIIALPVPPLEALIALSIAYVAVELVNKQRHQPAARYLPTWGVAFIFGLLHGMGFASALGETGLPPDSRLLALLLFNVGVEAGQLMFIAAYLLVTYACRAQLQAAPRWSRAAVPYAIGGIAMFWVIDRVVLFLP